MPFHLILIGFFWERILFEKDRAAMDCEIRGATVKVGCVRIDASSVDLPIP